MVVFFHFICYFGFMKFKSIDRNMKFSEDFESQTEDCPKNLTMNEIKWLTNISFFVTMCLIYIIIMIVTCCVLYPFNSLFETGNYFQISMLISFILSVIIVL
jgi:hypothetical protein